MAKLALDKALKKRNISHYRFALMLRTDMQNLSKYFRPDANPTLYTLSKWAKVLNCNVRDLIEEEKTKKA